MVQPLEQAERQEYCMDKGTGTLSHHRRVPMDLLKDHVELEFQELRHSRSDMIPMALCRPCQHHQILQESLSWVGMVSLESQQRAYDQWSPSVLMALKKRWNSLPLCHGSSSTEDSERHRERSGGADRSQDRRHPQQFCGKHGCQMGSHLR